MDALGPASVPHDPVHVPLIDKHVRGKVYEDLLSTAHISGKGRVTLINPLGVDLRGYESRLDQYIEECEEVMEKVTLGNISEVKLKELKEDLRDPVEYRKHREELRKGLQGSGCDHLVNELDQIEAEVKLAISLKGQSAALREESARKWRSKVAKSLSSDSSCESSAVCLSEIGTLPSGTRDKVKSITLKVSMK